MLLIALLIAFAAPEDSAPVDAPPPLLDGSAEPTPSAPPAPVPPRAPAVAAPPAAAPPVAEAPVQPAPAELFDTGAMWGAPALWSAIGWCIPAGAAGACATGGLMGAVVVAGTGGGAGDAFFAAIAFVGCATLMSGGLCAVAPIIAMCAGAAGAAADGREIWPIVLGAVPGVLLAMAGVALTLAVLIPSIGFFLAMGSAAVLLCAGPATVLGVAVASGFAPPRPAAVVSAARWRPAPMAY